MHNINTVENRKYKMYQTEVWQRITIIIIIDNTDHGFVRVLLELDESDSRHVVLHLHVKFAGVSKVRAGARVDQSTARAATPAVDELSRNWRRTGAECQGLFAVDLVSYHVMSQQHRLNHTDRHVLN